VTNLNVPGAEEVTIFPDHRDPNLYYLTPAAMVLAYDQRTQPQAPFFIYTELGWRRNQIRAILLAILEPQVDLERVERAKARVLEINPQARFTMVPMSSSRVLFGTILTPLIESSECNHIAGGVGQRQMCAFRLNPQGRNVMRRQFQRSLTIVTSFQYEVAGVIQNADNSYSNRTGTYQIVGHIGGPELSRWSDRFRDEWGRELDLSEDP
jgi:hypothetical protein